MVAITEDLCIKWNDQIIWPNQLDNRTNCHLVAGIFNSEVLTMSSTLDTYVCSAYNRVFDMILKYLHCSIGFKLAKEDFGGIIVNNSWTGILGLLDTKEADFIAHRFSVKNQRELIIDFDYLVPQMELLRIFSYPKVVYSDDPLKLFRCFTVPIWTSIVVFLVLYALFNFIHWWFTHLGTFSWSALLASLVDMFGVLIGQGSVRLSTKQTGHIARIPMILWVLCTFVLRQLFSSDITALLISGNENSIDYFDQLYQMSSDFYILIENRSSTQFFFNKIFPDLMSKTVLISHHDLGSYQTMHRLIQQNCVLVVNSGRAMQFKHMYPSIDFHLSNEGWVSSLGNYAVRKTLNGERKHKLNKLFKYLFYFGLNGKVDRTIEVNRMKNQLMKDGVVLQTNNRTRSNVDILPSDLTPGQNEDSSDRVVLTHLYIYSFGVILSIGCFLAEHILATLAFNS